MRGEDINIIASEGQLAMAHHISRRSFLAGATVLALYGQAARAQSSGWQFSLPIGFSGSVPGDGFYLRHGFTTENTAFFPGGWHTGEDYYAIDGDSAGATVLAVGDGEVVFAGYDYPGPVVIVRHADDLYSMYGHLDEDLAVERGAVVRGQVLGTVLDRNDGRSPSHLHFEMRRFLTTPEVNGSMPRYGFTCGPDCPPGPGYWPIDAPEGPAGVGWLNPLHALATGAFPDGVSDDAEVTVATGARETVQLWSEPADEDGAEPVGELRLVAGDRYPLQGIASGPAGSPGTSAEAYRLWYRITAPDMADHVWVQAVYATSDATGSDGRPSSLRFDFLPVVGS